MKTSRGFVEVLLVAVLAVVVLGGMVGVSLFSEKNKEPQSQVVVDENVGSGGKVITAATGVTSLGGLTGATQTFVNDTNVSVVSSGTTHTLTWLSTLAAGRGGTGASTLTGLLQGNGTGAITGITGTIGQFPYFNGTNTLLATSTISLGTDSEVGIMTASPLGSRLQIDSITGTPATLDDFHVLLKLKGKTSGNTDNNVGILFSSEQAIGAVGADYAKGGLVYTRADWGLGDFRFLQEQTTDTSDANLTDTVMIIKNNGNVGIATTTPGNRFSVNNLGSHFYISSTGKVVAYDTTNAWEGRVSPTRSFVLSSATTTAWTASTTASAYSPFLQMPFAGTLRQVRCGTDTSFLGVNVQVAGSNVTPSYFVASTTIGKVPFTAGNTFSAGQKILANFGTTTTSEAFQISCTFDVTETP